MSKKKHIYGYPSDNHKKAMAHNPELIVDIDLTHHVDKSYPAEGSADEKLDLQRVIDAATIPKLSSEYLSAVDQAIQTPFKAQAKLLGLTYPEDFINRLLKDAKHYILILKYHFNRPRPQQVAQRLGISLNMKLTPSSHTPAFPSGHSAQARLIATILSRLSPRNRKKFELVADTIDRSRLDLGIHFPTDLDAGRKLGKHMGLVSPLPKSTGLMEAIDPLDTDIKVKVGFRLIIDEAVSIPAVQDAIKAIRGITTTRQIGAQRHLGLTGRTAVNMFVTAVGGSLTPEELHRRILNLDGVRAANIRNVDGQRWTGSEPRRTSGMSERLLREYVRELLTEDSRTAAGDAAQKRVAAWLVDSGFTASVNKSGSQSADVMGKSSDGATGVIESKNSEAGSHVYSQELTTDSAIANAINFLPGNVSAGISFTRFRPSVNKEPILDMKIAIDQRSKENELLQQALSSDSRGWSLVAGGAGPEGEVSIGLAQSGPKGYGQQVTFDGTLVQRDGRAIAIVVAPNMIKVKGKWQTKAPANSPSRVFFISDSFARKARPGMGGSGEETMGVFMDPGSKKLTKAWEEYYRGHDDYFAIVTGTKMYIGKIGDNDPLGLGLPKLTVALSMSSNSTMSYGGMNVTGLREKVMISVMGGITITIPSDASAEQYVANRQIIVRSA